MKPKTTVVNNFLNASENASENELENALENEVENTLENAEKCVFDHKNTEKMENEHLKNDREPPLENDRNSTLENDPETTVEIEEEMDSEMEDDLGENMGDAWQEEDYQEHEEETEDLEEDTWGFPDEEENADPLDESVEQDAEQEKNMEDIYSEVTGDSAKNNELLLGLGDLVMEKLDNSKALICSAISGKDPANYTSDKRLNKALLKAFVNYLNSQELKAPSPFGTLLFALAIWGLPTLGAAYFHRIQSKKAGNDLVEDLIEVEAEAQSDGEDYSQTKEFKDNRRVFTIHKETGCYNRTPDGKFCRTSVATEKPSPAIQKLLDQDLDSAAIRELLYPK